MATKIFNVILTKKGHWEILEQVRSSGLVELKRSKPFSTKEAAIKSAVESAKQNRSAVIIHSRDGKIEKSASYSSSEPYLPSSIRYK